MPAIPGEFDPSELAMTLLRSRQDRASLSARTAGRHGSHAGRRTQESNGTTSLGPGKVIFWQPHPMACLALPIALSGRQCVADSMQVRYRRYSSTGLLMYCLRFKAVRFIAPTTRERPGLHLVRRAALEPCPLVWSGCRNRKIAFLVYLRVAEWRNCHWVRSSKLRSQVTGA